MNTQNSTTPNILVIGSCVTAINNIKLINKSIDFNIIQKQFSNNIQNEIHRESTIAIFLCCGIDDKKELEIVSHLYRTVPYIPLFAIFSEKAEKHFLYELYKYGIMDHIYSVEDELGTEMLNRKIELLVDTYKYREQWLIERIKTNNYSISLNANMKAYIGLLDLMKIAYVIIDPDCYVVETNTYFNNILRDSNLVGCNFEELIDKPFLDDFNDSLEKMFNGDAAEDLELKLIKNNGSDTVCAWIRLNGNSIDYNGHKILIMIKDISTKKNNEYIKFIEREKKRDMLKQNIKLVRQQLKVYDNANNK